jgi:hypothetical protein
VVQVAVHIRPAWFPPWFVGLRVFIFVVATFTMHKEVNALWFSSGENYVKPSAGTAFCGCIGACATPNGAHPVRRRGRARSGVACVCTTAASSAFFCLVLVASEVTHPNCRAVLLMAGRELGVLPPPRHFVCNITRRVNAGQCAHGVTCVVGHASSSLATVH